MIDLVFGRRVQGKTTLGYWLARKTPTCVVFAPRPDVLESHRALPNAVGLFELLDSAPEIIIKPPVAVIPTFEETCGELRAWLELNPDEEISLLVDEARFIKSTENISESFDWLLRFTNPKKVNVILTAHRPVDVSVDIRAIADFWFIFHTTQEHDLKVIAERCGNAVADEVRHLEDGQLVIWNDARGVSRKHTDRALWYVPINLPKPEGVYV